MGRSVSVSGRSGYSLKIKKMSSKITKDKIQTPSGMPDILPEDQPYYKKIYRIVEAYSSFYGFSEITPPILEHAELFEKGTGADTDIIEKQMYVLRTKGGDFLALRPEFTPSLARAYIQHGMNSLSQPVKLFSFGPLFRQDRPQAGRLRQFHQFNLEAFGSERPAMDVQIIYLFYNIFQSLGIKDIVIQINSIGDRECQPEYKKLLINYLKKNIRLLCPDCRRRLKTNPLRVLDCKEESCQQTIAAAPQAIDHLCKPCHNHFRKVLELLDDLGLPYNLNPYLVRGLDYYTRTVFEITVEKELQKAQSSLAGGGRYDNLIKLFSNKEVSAFGAAGGVERVIAAMKEREIKVPTPASPEVFLAQLGDTAKIKAFNLLEDFRKANLSVSESLDRGSLSAQLKIADKQEVKYTLILGEEETKRSNIILRDMKTGKQTTIKLEKVIEELKKLLRADARTS